VSGGRQLQGVEAVIDKDRASALLASCLGVDLFVISTDTEYCIWITRNPRSVRCDRLERRVATYASSAISRPETWPKSRIRARFLRTRQGSYHYLCENLCQAVIGSVGTHMFPIMTAGDRAQSRLELPVEDANATTECHPIQSPASNRRCETVCH